MNRFALTKPANVTIEHVNLRDEKHGDDTVTAIDIKLSMEVSNDVLNLFYPALKQWVYFKSATPPIVDQASLPLEEPNDLPDLRFPELEPLRWGSELQGYTLTIDYGIGGDSSIRLSDCKVNNFRLECKQGGTVKVVWRVQRSEPGGHAIGQLSGLLKREVSVTLTPSPEAQAVLDESDGAEHDATDAFLEQHAHQV